MYSLYDSPSLATTRAAKRHQRPDRTNGFRHLMMIKDLSTSLLIQIDEIERLLDLLHFGIFGVGGGLRIVLLRFVADTAHLLL